MSIPDPAPEFECDPTDLRCDPEPDLRSSRSDGHRSRAPATDEPHRRARRDDRLESPSAERE